MQNNNPQHPQTSLGRGQIVLGIVGILALAGYFMYAKFGFFMIPGLFYAKKTVTYYEEKSDLLESYRQPNIEELNFEYLEPLIEPKMSPFRDDFCTVIQDEKTYDAYAAAYGGELCADCANTDFDKYSILGQVVEDVQYVGTGKPGFNKFVFKNPEWNLITYIVTSNDVYNPDGKMSFIDTVHAAYLEPDSKWLIKIPRIPDDYSVECQAWTN